MDKSRGTGCQLAIALGEKKIRWQSVGSGNRRTTLPTLKGAAGVILPALGSVAFSAVKKQFGKGGGSGGIPSRRIMLPARQQQRGGSMGKGIGEIVLSSPHLQKLVQTPLNTALDFASNVGMPALDRLLEREQAKALAKLQQKGGMNPRANAIAYGKVTGGRMLDHVLSIADNARMKKLLASQIKIPLIGKFARKKAVKYYEKLLKKGSNVADGLIHSGTTQMGSGVGRKRRSYSQMVAQAKLARAAKARKRLMQLGGRGTIATSKKTIPITTPVTVPLGTSPILVEAAPMDIKRPSSIASRILNSKALGAFTNKAFEKVTDTALTKLFG